MRLVNCLFFCFRAQQSGQVWSNGRLLRQSKIADLASPLFSDIFSTHLHVIWQIAGSSRAACIMTYSKSGRISQFSCLSKASQVAQFILWQGQPQAPTPTVLVESLFFIKLLVPVCQLQAFGLHPIRSELPHCAQSSSSVI